MNATVETFRSLKATYLTAVKAYDAVYRTKRVDGGIVVEHIDGDSVLIGERERAMVAAGKAMEAFANQNRTELKRVFMTDRSALTVTI